MCSREILPICHRAKFQSLLKTEIQTIQKRCLKRALSSTLANESLLCVQLWVSKSHLFAFFNFFLYREGGKNQIVEKKWQRTKDKGTTLATITMLSNSPTKFKKKMTWRYLPILRNCYLAPRLLETDILGSEEVEINNIY